MADRDNENYYLEGYFDSVAEPVRKKGREKKKTRHMSAGKCAIVILAVVAALCAILAAIYLVWSFDVVVTGNEGNVNIRIARVERRGNNPEDRIDLTSDPLPKATPQVDQLAPAPSGSATLRITGDPFGNELNDNEVSSKVSRSIVSVAVVRSGAVSYASGVIMSDRGYVITCCHAVENGDITVCLGDGSMFPARIVGMDEATDIAVLSVEGAELKSAEFGDSDLAEVGDRMYVFSCLPTGTCFMTDCLVSAIDGNVYFNGVSTPLILTNASVRAWNTGGVLVNSAGKVVGIVDVELSSIYGEDQLCCAIPVKMAKPVIDELIEKGYVEGRPAFGLELSDVPAAMSAYLGIPRGAMIASVNENSEAYAKGLSRGDVVVAVNGSEISGVGEFNRIKNSLHVGDTAVLAVYRAGTIYYVELTVQDSSEVR